MRTKEVIKGFKNSQKIRVIVDGVGIYMTVGEVVSKFATTTHREATEIALERLAQDRSLAYQMHGWSGVPSGFATRLSLNGRDVDVQVDIL